MPKQNFLELLSMPIVRVELTVAEIAELLFSMGCADDTAFPSCIGTADHRTEEVYADCTD